MRRILYWLLIAAFYLSISPGVFAVFTPPGESGVTQKDVKYADNLWQQISWDSWRAKQYNEVSLKLPKADHGYSWMVSLDTGNYVGIRVEWKSAYSGPGDQELILKTNPQGTGFYIQLIKIPQGGIVASETYIYQPDTGLKHIPAEQRVTGAIDGKGNITGLYDVWGKQIVNETVYSHQINRFMVFPDVNAASWAYNVIYKMSAAGYINGYPGRSVKPDGNITRAEFTVVLDKLLKDKYSYGATSSSEIIFSDLKPAYWSYQATNHLLRYMAPKDVTNIFGDKFYPDKYITREEAAAVLYSILKNHPAFTGHIKKNPVFSDIKSSKYLDGISFSYSEGFMVGYPDNLFKPNGNITRAETAALMSKVFDLIQ